MDQMTKDSARIPAKGPRGSEAMTFVVLFVLSLTATLYAPAQTFTVTVLHNFYGETDGRNPFGGLVRDAAGNLYGTTLLGGESGCGNERSCGTVFKVSKSGKETVLHRFTGNGDGGNPPTGLVRDSMGNLYGTAWVGGAFDFGVVYELSSSGAFTVLHSFSGGTSDGCFPYGGLLIDKTGNLYGTTNECGGFGEGLVYELSSARQYTILHNFAGGPSDGAYPNISTLSMDGVGNLYGTTVEGGTLNIGVVYELTSSSGALTVLHSFAYAPGDGSNPDGTLAMDRDGNLYGTTVYGGKSDNGIVYKVSSDGTYTVLHNFAGGSKDGATPYGGLILDANGRLYGDTTTGGTYDSGTVFKITVGGVLNILHDFAGSHYPSDGANPMGGVILDGEGNLYGTADDGGKYRCGTVWELAK